MRRAAPLMLLAAIPIVFSGPGGAVAPTATEDPPGFPPLETDHSTVVSLAPLTILSDLVFDRANRRLFIGGEALLRADPDGSNIVSVPGVSGVAGIALGSGEEVVVAEPLTSDLLVVDPVTATVVRRVPTGLRDGCLDDVTATAGVYVFSYGCDESDYPPSLGLWDPANDRVVLGLIEPYDYNDDLTQVEAVPKHPGRVIFDAQEQLFRVDIDVEDPSRTTKSRPMREGFFGWRTYSIAFDDSGETMVLSEETSSGPRYTRAYSTDTLEEVYRWEDRNTGAPLEAVAVRDDGRLAVGEDAAYAADLTLYPWRSQTPVRQVDFGDMGSTTNVPYDGVILDGLEFDGDEVIAVVGSIYDRYIGLRRTSAGPPVPMSLTAGSASRQPGDLVRLEAVTSRPGDRVDLYERTHRGAKLFVASTVTDSAGRAWFDVEPTETSTYESRVLGPSQTYVSQSGSTAVAVPARVAIRPAVGRRVGVDRWRVPSGTRTRLLGEIQTADPGVCTSWAVQVWQRDAWRGFVDRPCVRLDVNGRAKTSTPQLRRGTVIRARTDVAGGPRNSAASSGWVLFSASP